MTLIGVLAPLGLLVLLMMTAYVRLGSEGVRSGLSSAGTLFLGVAPQMAIGFLLAGFVALLLPREVVAGWLGEESGWKGLLVASVAGIVTPGGPFTHFPLLAALRTHGAGVGPITSYISAWALLGVHRMLVWEGPLLGWRFVAARAAACLLCPPLTGWFAQVLIRAVLPRSA